MNVRQIVVTVGLASLSLGALPSCKKDEPPPPKAENEKGGRAHGKMNLRNNAARVDPQAMKDYRLDVCVYGTLALFQAREAYTASLGKDEPSENKIPSFGLNPAQPAAAAVAAPAPAPSGSAAAGAPDKKHVAAAASAAPSAAPSASAAASAAARAVAPSARRNFDLARAPYERNARACVAAAALKEPPMPEVDAALKDFAPYAAELAKNVVTANAYYTREDYKKDSFEKGKALHKSLTEGFAKLDEMHKKVADAVTAWRKEHPADLSKASEGEKIIATGVDDGRAALLAYAATKPDAEAFKSASTKAAADSEALKTFAKDHQSDMWGKIVQTPLDMYARNLKDAEAKLDAHDNETYLTLVNGFVGLVESRQRALSRSIQHVGMPLGGPRGHGGPLPRATAESKPAPVPAPHE
ncbi:MAG TPA: DUF3829 domain-containing protein [Byssovorax sp.]|jgi:hypothetical protein